MIHYRLEDPPKDIGDECERLIHEYYSQYDDDEELPENDNELFYAYFDAHASERAKAYNAGMKEILAEAMARGIHMG